MAFRSGCLRLVTIAVVAIGCGSSPSSPSAPPAPLPTSPAVRTLEGQVIGTVTGEPITGATVTVGSLVAVTDAQGVFTLADTSEGVRQVSISGPGVIPRQSRVSFTDREVTIDVIQDRAPFDLAFFRELGRNALESEGGLEPLRPIPTAPRFHIRTVDEAGRPMSPAILNLVEGALRDAAPIWSANRHPIEVIQRGPSTRQGESGWITVLFAAETTPGSCGRATLGSVTGFMELNYLSESCSCAGNDIAPRTVRHELGHVYGYWHTGNRGGVMSRTWTTRQCNGRPSAREVEHARYMYARSNGNLDPDVDPVSRVLREPFEIVVED